MAADVSSLVRVTDGADKSEPPSMVPITRDFLGGCSALDSKEMDLDLDLQVPCGWEKRLDLKSGRVLVQKRNPANSSTSTSETSKTMPHLQDLNFPPLSKQTLNLFDDSNLDLKLVSSSNYQSVCTLDKVKSALERAEKEAITRKRSLSMSKSSSPPNSKSNSNCSSSTKEEERSHVSFASGCPNCLLYVLISRSSPTCPRCNIVVPLPAAAKKPRIDLNASV